MSDTTFQPFSIEEDVKSMLGQSAPLVVDHPQQPQRQQGEEEFNVRDGAEFNAGDGAEFDVRDGADNELAATVAEQADKIKDLELALSDARKLIRDREDLLSVLQWRPKEDFYVWKNPQIGGTEAQTAQERKVKALLDQMRVMEKLLVDREKVIVNLSSADNSPFNSPMSIHQPKYAGSPAGSPMGVGVITGMGSSGIVSTAPLGSPSLKKSSFGWLFKKSTNNLSHSQAMRASTSSFSSLSGSGTIAPPSSLASSDNSSKSTPPQSP